MVGIFSKKFDLFRPFFNIVVFSIPHLFHNLVCMIPIADKSLSVPAEEAIGQYKTIILS